MEHASAAVTRFRWPPCDEHPLSTSSQALILLYIRGSLYRICKSGMVTGIYRFWSGLDSREAGDRISKLEKGLA